MTFGTTNHILRRRARVGSLKAHLVSLMILLAIPACAQSTPAQPPSLQSAASQPDNPLTPAEINDLKLKLAAHEDWTKLSIKDLGLVPYRPLPDPGKVDRPQFTRQLVRLQWRSSDPVDVYVVLPKDVKKPRVVLYLYGYPSDASRLTSDDWCAGAIKGGFAAVGFVSALTGERFHAPRPMKSWFVSDLQESLATTTHDVQMILNYLETRDDLNMDRVAMYGQGSGATIAILAASVDHRIQVLDLLNPWGDWSDWLKQSAWVPDGERPDYLRPEFLEKVAAFDPVQVLPRLTTPVVRLQQVKDDRITPTAAREQIAAALPHGAVLLQSNSWPEYMKAFAEQNLWGWAKEKLAGQPEPTRARTSGGS
jgi:cephalosporin-C deacetylase-like acetyl esterase